MAIDNGNIDAQNNLGVLYERENKLELAEKYYADSGDTKSQRKLGNLYYFDLGKYDLAEKYLKMSIKNNDTESLKTLGIFYYNRWDYESAEKYFKPVAEKGDVKSQAFLASVYDNLNKKDLAKKYYKIAADNGDMSSQYYLACMYEEEGKMNLAAKYFLKAAQHKDKKLVEKYMIEEDIEQLYKLIEQKIVNLDDLEEE